MRDKMSDQSKNKNSGSVWFLITGVVLVTLYFNAKAYDPFNTPKLIILLLTSGWLSGHIFQHYRSIHSNIHKKELLFLITPAAFVSSQLISLLFTDLFTVGLIGDTQRRNGFISYLALAVILIFCAIRINYFFASRIIKTAIIVGVVLCIYGLMQITGNDFEPPSLPAVLYKARVGVDLSG